MDKFKWPPIWNVQGHCISQNGCRGSVTTEGKQTLTSKQVSQYDLNTYAHTVVNSATIAGMPKSNAVLEIVQYIR